MCCESNLLFVVELALVLKLAQLLESCVDALLQCEMEVNEIPSIALLKLAFQ